MPKPGYPNRPFGGYAAEPVPQPKKPRGKKVKAEPVRPFGR
jgi:hypothetical protein